MSPHTSLLPWNGQRVNSTGNLRSFFAKVMPPRFLNYLPRRFEVCAGYDVAWAEVQELVEAAKEFLPLEYERRSARIKQIVDQGHFSESQLADLLAPTSLQPWIIYYSKNGGLDENQDGQTQSHGIIPCATMNNHGVAWRVAGGGNYRTWLVTARSKGAAWDMDSDIGHESAHASFASIPLFGQTIERSFSEFTLSKNLLERDLSAGHLARICYLICELAVVIVRNEIRQTETEFPVESAEELESLLHLCDRLFPMNGFLRATQAYRDLGSFAAHSQEAVLAVGAAAIKTVSLINDYAREPDITKIMRSLFHLQEKTTQCVS